MMMSTRAIVVSLATALSLVALQGCAVGRGQSTVGAYIDDSAITTAVKAKFVESKQVDAAAISVETLNGTVMLSGFAKSQNERATAESLARGVSGVKQVKNELSVRS